MYEDASSIGLMTMAVSRGEPLSWPKRVRCAAAFAAFLDPETRDVAQGRLAAGGRMTGKMSDAPAQSENFIVHLHHFHMEVGS